MITEDQRLSKIALRPLALKLYPETRKLMELSREHGWDSHILGRADFPTEPVRLEKWMITPAYLDNSPIPERTMERIQTVYASGIRPKGFVMVHEAPRLLSAPVQKKTPCLALPAPAVKEPPRMEPQKEPANIPSAGSDLLLTLLGIAGAAMAAFVMMFFSVAVGIDPIVVAVMEDGTWVEIDRWNIT